MAVAFGDLPAEILTEIAGNIDGSHWVLNFALSCRFLHAITLPILYSRVTIAERTRMTRRFRLENAVNRILTTPRFASYLRVFTMRSQPIHLTVPLAYNDRFQRLLNASAPSATRCFQNIENSRKSCEEAFMVLLILSCSKIERLDLSVPLLRHRYLESAVNEIIGNSRWLIDPPQSALSSLKSVIFRCKIDCTDSGCHLMSSFLQLPWLRSFYGQSLANKTGWRLHSAFAQLAVQSIYITHLELRDCELQQRDILAILNACGQLRTFIYDIPTFGFHLVEAMPALLAALTVSSGSLENLWLDVGRRSAYRPLRCGDPIHSLARLQNLKNIKLASCLLFGQGVDILINPLMYPTETAILLNGGNLANILPATIETIYISQTRGRLILLTTALERLFREKWLFTPYLRRVVMEYESYAPNGGFYFSSLDAVADEAGVELIKINTTLTPAVWPSTQQDTGHISEKGQGLDGSLTWAAPYGLKNPGDDQFEFLM